MQELLLIFSVFLKVGLFTFGGGYTMLPILQKELIDKRNLLKQEEIVDYFAIAQSIPGIIAINVSVFVGYKVKGIKGSIAAMLGMIIPSIVIILIVAAFLQGFMDIELVQKAFVGIRIAVAALIVNAFITVFKSGIKTSFTFVLFVVSLVLLLLLPNISPIIIILLSGAVSIIYSVVKKENV